MLVGVYPWRSPNANRIANVVGVHFVHDQVIGTFTVRFSVSAASFWLRSLAIGHADR
jgi:hypothetical protein